MFWATVIKPATKKQAIFLAHTVNRPVVKYQYGAKLKIFVRRLMVTTCILQVQHVFSFVALLNLNTPAKSTRCILRRRIGNKFIELRSNGGLTVWH